MRRAQKPEGRARSGGNRTLDGEAAGDLLRALADEDSRALLRAVEGEALSVNELSEACDLPLSTTYRKVDMLTEAGLLEEQLRLRSSGKHTSEYILDIETVELSLTGGGIDVTVSDRTDQEEGEQSRVVLAGAD
jgi:DNA-binding transcriptional ArsR family regulator